MEVSAAALLEAVLQGQVIMTGLRLIKAQYEERTTIAGGAGHGLKLSVGGSASPTTLCCCGLFFFPANVQYMSQTYVKGSSNLRNNLSIYMPLICPLITLTISQSTGDRISVKLSQSAATAASCTKVYEASAEVHCHEEDSSTPVLLQNTARELLRHMQEEMVPSPGTLLDEDKLKVC